MTFPIKSVISKLIGNKTSFMIFSHRSTYFFGNAANLWHIFIFAGVFALTAPYLITLEVSMTRTVIVGCIALIIGLALRFNYYGVQIDYENAKCRDFTCTFGLRTGSWKKLPNLKKVILTKQNVSSWNTPNGISPTFKTGHTIYTIALFGDEPQPALIIQTENEKEAKENAGLLADKLQLVMEYLA
jgi:hypothetical protein